MAGVGSISDGLSADFFGGTTTVVASQDLGAFHVALAGRQYMVDLQEYQRTILDSQAPQNDDGAEPGEQSLSRAGFWARAQTDWSFGADQTLFDGPDSDRRRFLASKGVDGWEPMELSMLHDTAERHSTIEGNVDVFSVASRIYIVDGQFIRHTDDLDTATPTLTDVDALADIVDWTTDGNRIFLVFGAAQAARVMDVDGTTTSAFGTETPDIIEYANGRLVAADGADLFELDDTGAKVGAANIFTDPRGGAEWVAATGSPAAIFAAVTVNDISEVYSIGVDDTSTALSAPTYAAGIAFGETINALDAYPPGQLVVIGTSKGLRMATVNNDGRTLSVHERIDIEGGVEAVVIRDRFCFFTWTNPDVQTTGIGRADLSASTSQASFVPPFAEDVQAGATQGMVQGVVSFQGANSTRERRYFAINGSGIWGEVDNLVSEGFVDSGEIRFGILPNKVFTGVDIRHSPSPGEIAASVTFESGTTIALGQTETDGTTRTTLANAAGSDLSASLRLTLFRNPADPTVGPVIRAWVLNALPQPSRVIEFIVPFVLYSEISDLRGKAQRFDPLREMRRLEALASTSQLVPYQEGSAFYEVRVASAAIGQGDVRAWQRGGIRWFQAKVLARLLSKEF